VNRQHDRKEQLMPPNDESLVADDGDRPEERLTRTDLVRRAAVVGAALAAAPAFAGTASAKLRTAATARAGKGKVVIGAFQDGALTAFKNKIIPLFQRETGIKIEFVEDSYDSTFEKQFQDGSTKAGQFDIYVMDDPWVPQFAATPILQNLSKLGLKNDPDLMQPFMETAYWPPRKGPRLPDFRDDKPQLYAMPFVGDMQSLTYRRDVLGNAPKTWKQLVGEAKAKMSPPKTYGYVFRGLKGNPIVTSWFPVFYSQGGKLFDDRWHVLFSNAAGKRAAEFFVHTLKSLAPPGVVEYDSTQEGAAILGGKALSIVQYSGNALLSDDPKSTKLVGKLAFSTVPRGPGGSIAQIGIFISGISVSAPNLQNAITFQKWFVTKKAQLALARAGSLPIRRSAFVDKAAQRRNPLQKTILAQLDAGALARPRTPDWAKIESILGTELNKALQAGTIGNHLDTAAKQVTDYLKKNGYYK
jgi:multiple sugar transport system substrate-binding protein